MINCHTPTFGRVSQEHGAGQLNDYHERMRSAVSEVCHDMTLVFGLDALAANTDKSRFEICWNPQGELQWKTTSHFHPHIAEWCTTHFDPPSIRLKSLLWCCGFSSFHGSHTVSATVLTTLIVALSLSLRASACYLWFPSLCVSDVPSRRVHDLLRCPFTVCALCVAFSAGLFCGRFSERRKGFSTLTFNVCERTNSGLGVECWVFYGRDDNHWQERICLARVSNHEGWIIATPDGDSSEEVFSELEEWVICGFSGGGLASRPTSPCHRFVPLTRDDIDGLIEQGRQVAHDNLVLAVAPPPAPIASSVDTHATVWLRHFPSFRLVVQTVFGLSLKQEEVSRWRIPWDQGVAPWVRLKTGMLPRCRQGPSLPSL